MSIINGPVMAGCLRTSSGGEDSCLCDAARLLPMSLPLSWTSCLLLQRLLVAWWMGERRERRSTRLGKTRDETRRVTRSPNCQRDSDETDECRAKPKCSQASRSHHFCYSLFPLVLSCSYLLLQPTMCGILALHGVDKPQTLRAKVLAMSKKLRHRGPDWSGCYVGKEAVLAHERLAIVGVGKSIQHVAVDQGSDAYMR